MALDKIVDSSQLDADLTTVADAIRAKGGTSAQLSFPIGMASAIAAISGGIEITDGIVVKARDVNGYATEVDYYKADGIINPSAFYRRVNETWDKLTTINFMSTITTLKSQCFRNSAIVEFNFPEVTSIEGDVFRSLPNCKTVILPKITNLGIPQYIFGESKMLETVQIGSIGHTLTAFRSTNFWMTPQAFLTITAYTNASYADTILTNIRTGAPNATIIIKASEATTYNGVSYAAGETMVTSEVA